MMAPVHMALQIQTFPTGLLETNCFVVYDDITKEAAIVDPGDKNPLIVQFVQKQQLKVTYILATHAHFDHVFGVGYFKQEFKDAKFCCHTADEQLLKGAPLFSAMFGVEPPSNFPQKADIWFNNNFTFSLGDYGFKTIFTPGHTPGGVCFFCPKAKVIFTGDTLFYGNIGRTDFPGSSPEDMAKSIQRLSKEIPDDFLIYPGHDSTGKSFKTAINIALKLV